MIKESGLNAAISGYTVVINSMNNAKVKLANISHLLAVIFFVSFISPG